jgi:hypothetical protein
MPTDLHVLQALPAAPVVPHHPDAEEVTLRDADISNLGRGGHGGRSGATQEDEEDEDDGRGGQRVQVCCCLLSHCRYRVASFSLFVCVVIEVTSFQRLTCACRSCSVPNNKKIRLVDEKS